jgi:hypothetical protein
MATQKSATNTSVRFPKSTPASDAGKSPTELIDARILELRDWRGEVLSRVRAVIRQADPRITEEWKWNGPVWSCHGIICTGETYKKAVKLTFAKGAMLADPSRLFNSSLEGNARRAIDIPQDAHMDEAALSDLIRAAIGLNLISPSSKARGGAAEGNRCVS